MNRWEHELYDLNCQIDAIKKREYKVICDTRKQFKKEREQLEKRKKQILTQIRGENELLETIYEEE